MNSAEKFNFLSGQNRQADSHFKDWNEMDSISHLSKSKIKGWQNSYPERRRLCMDGRKDHAREKERWRTLMKRMLNTD